MTCMSGRVLYIFTPPPGVPFRFKSKRGATQPSQVTNSNHVTAGVTRRASVHAFTLVGFARSVCVGVCVLVEQNQMQIGRKVHNLSARPQKQFYGKQ